MPRPRPIAIESLEPRLQFAACPAILPATEHALTTDFVAAADTAATNPAIEITLEDGTIVPTEPPDSNPIGTAPRAIDFGAIIRNQQATAKAFLIKNLGVNPLSVGDITLPDGFVLIQAPPASIAPGESGTVLIGLDTTTAGGYVGPVVIASDNPDAPLLSFRISGEVLPPPISIASVSAPRLPASLVAGATTPRRPIVVTLRNETDLPFADSISLAVHASSDATLDAGDTKLAKLVKPLHLAAGRTRTLKLMLSADAFPAGDFTVIASVTAANVTDATAGPQVSVRSPFVRLTSQAGNAPTAPATPMAIGKKTPLVISITNEGNVATTLTPATFNVAVSTDGTADTIVASTSVASKLRIAPGKSRPVKLAVAFAADAFPAGAYQLLVTVSAQSNDTNGTFLVTLPVRFA